MDITTITLLLSILSLILSFGFVGIIPSTVCFCLSIYLFSKEKSLNSIRSLAISFAGIILPMIMYVNSYGVTHPYEKKEELAFVPQILYDNYENLGFDMSYLLKDNNDSALTSSGNPDITIYSPVYENADQQTSQGSSNATSPDDAIYYVKDGQVEELATYDNEIFENIENEETIEDATSTSTNFAASDDNMPSYGGLPVGTIVLAQYFREDDHNCNPVLVLRNKTGNTCRYECKFIARDENGNELSTFEKTVEVVKDGDCFVFEGRFDKRLLQGVLPAMYEFSITKRTPYEVDASKEVSVYTRVTGNSAVVTADNHSSKKVKVDAYVLFFDKNELVDCIWLIPQNTDDVCIVPGTTANIQGDAYYHFDRIETYYTAYEASDGEG